MKRTRQLCLKIATCVLLLSTAIQAQINQDSLLLLIQNESVDTSKLNHLIAAIKSFDFESKDEIESYFKMGLKLTKSINEPTRTMDLYDRTGRSLLEINEKESAAEKFVQLQSLAIEHKHIRYQAQSIFNQALILAKERKPEEEIKLLQEALGILKGSDEYALQASILSKMAIAEKGMGRPKVALKLLDSAEALYDRQTDVPNYLEALNARGRIYRSIGKYDSARLTYAKVIKIAQAEKEDGSLARAYNNLGNIEQLTGNVEGALAQYVKSLEIKERIGNKRGIALAHYNIGTIKAGMKSYPASIANFRKSKKLAKEIEYTKVVQLSELKIGNSYNEMSQIDSALIYHHSALQIAEDSKDKKGIALTYLNLGTDYVTLKDFGQAFKYLTGALDIARETGNVAYEGGALSYIATAYLDAKKMAAGDSSFQLESLELSDKQIEEYLLEANKIANDVDNFEVKEASLEGLNYLYTKTNNYKANAAILKEHLILKDSMFSKERADAIADWETKYETAEKEKEITKLEAAKEKSAARIRLWSVISLLLFSIIGIGSYLFIQLQKVRKKLLVQNDQLTELNQTKDRFFGIIAHDIRSPIVALESVDEQMDYFLKKEDTHKLTELGSLVGKTARHLNSLLDNLLNWALVQTNSIPYHPESINVSQAWRDTTHLFEANAQVKNIKFVAEIDSDLEVYADTASFNTILRNLTSNALKFSEQDSTVTFSAVKSNDLTIFKVKDEGIGMSKEKISKLFTLEKKSQKGTAGEKGTGLGLILCKDLVELNKGNIFVESTEGKGSTFSFTMSNSSQ